MGPFYQKVTVATNDGLWSGLALAPPTGQCVKVYAVSVAALAAATAVIETGVATGVELFSLEFGGQGSQTVGPFYDNNGRPVPLCQSRSGETISLTTTGATTVRVWVMAQVEAV